MDDDLRNEAAETGEWLDALDSVEAFEGLNRIDEILNSVVTSARRKGAQLPFAAHTAINTIPSRRSTRAAGRPGARTRDPPLCPLERGGDCVARQP